jgi:hypothetical protein
MNNTITKLEYEKINNVYSKAKYAGFDVTMNMENGYINATKLCADGGKQMKNWLRNECNKELVEYFEENWSAQKRANLLIVVNTGVNELRGTYVHPDLIPHIASWVSPAFAYKVSKIVNNFLIKEKEDEIIRSKVLLGEKDCKIDELKIMLEKSDRLREEANIERREAEKRAEKMLQDMIDQNNKTHEKLDKTEKVLEKAEIDNDKIKTTLNRVEARVEKIVEEVVPPTKQISLHEQFGIMKLNDKSGKYQYKVYCTQARNVGTAKYSIIKAYPKAELFLEIKPNANAKNFLHKLKELYSRGDDAKIKLSYNYVNLVGNVNENELRDMVDGVVEHAKNFGNE